MDIADVGQWIALGFEVASYRDCLMYARDIEEREIWRQKWVDAETKRAALMDEYIMKYRANDIQMDPNRRIRVETYTNMLVLPIVNNDEGNNNEKR